MSFFYNGQSGRPYSVQFNGNPNDDNRTNNDIIYVPKADCSDVILINGTWDQLNAFIDADSQQELPRPDPAAECRSRTVVQPTRPPLGRRPAGGRQGQLGLHDGRVELPEPAEQRLGMAVLSIVPKLVGNGLLGTRRPLRSAIGLAGVDPATNKERINLATITSPNFLKTFERDDPRSRYQAQTRRSLPVLDALVALLQDLLLLDSNRPEPGNRFRPERIDPNLPLSRPFLSTRRKSPAIGAPCLCGGKSSSPRCRP